MPKPFKRPNSEVFWFRKRVPNELRLELKATEITRSLKTKDPAIAKALNDRLHAEYDDRWGRLRKETVGLDPRGANALAGEFYRRLVARHERTPGEPGRWRMKFIHDQVRQNLIPRKMPPDNWLRRNGSSWVGNNYGLILEIRGFLQERGLRLDRSSAHRFLLEAARANLLAIKRLELYANRQFPEDANGTAFAPAEDPRKALKTWDVLFDEYAKERNLAERTYRSWKSSILKMMVFAGVVHPADLTYDHVEAFRMHLVARELDAGQTIRRGYIGAAKAFLTWCVGRRYIGQNPIATMRVLSNPKEIVREPGYKDGEAVRILAATLRPQAAKISDRTADTRRWVPWLCAYTGARIEEITQLRHRDIKQTGWHRRYPDPVWYIDLTPAAGHIKAGVFRHVPIHPDLVELGFLDFVETRKGLPLFVDPTAARKRKDLRGLTASAANRLGRWIRTIVSDDVLSPNHAWRHRFITEAGEVKVPEEIRDAITGHAPESRGGRYGYKRPQLLLEWMLTMTSHLDLVRHEDPEAGRAVDAAHVPSPPASFPAAEGCPPVQPMPVRPWSAPSVS